MYPSSRFFLVVTTLAAGVVCRAADVVFLQSPASPPAVGRDMAAACNFYGLDLKMLTVSDKSNDALMEHLLEQNSTLAIAIAADALPSIDRVKVESAARRASSHELPVLIVGITEKTDSAALKTWSDGAIIGATPAKNSTPGDSYQVGHVEDFTRELSDVEIPYRNGTSCGLIPGRSDVEAIASVIQGHRNAPVFVRGADKSHSVFFTSQVLHTPSSFAGWDARQLADTLPEITPILLFLKYSGGERAWHAPHHYANLTIDDAWLREPYGHVSYRGLLREMEKHRFHSTIAFIPWNYDRSQSDVVELFRDHPEQFSICIHGDNHDHKEFTDYRHKPLDVQILDMKQALARMDQFQRLTRVPYDKVMVFPHSIAPEATLAALKGYNYLATTNSWNVPMDQAKPTDLSYALRPVTLAFGDFPSITRYSVEAKLPAGFVAMQEFLENPLLFYCHQGFFADDTGAFNQIADEVNRIEPGVRWSNLGEISKYLYELRSRDDADYDVLSFSSRIFVENTSEREATFYVKKSESGRPSVRRVTVAGKPFPYRLEGGYLEVDVTVPARTTRDVSIEYINDLKTAPVSIAKTSVEVRFLRLSSDFRDIVLSRVAVGEWFVHFYYDHDMTPSEVVGGAFVLTLLLAAGGRVLWWVLRRPLPLPDVRRLS